MTRTALVGERGEVFSRCSLRVIPGLAPRIPAGGCDGHSGEFLRRSNRDSRDALRLHGNDAECGGLRTHFLLRTDRLALRDACAFALLAVARGPSPHGGPGTRDGPAWVGFAGRPASPVEEKRGIPRPQRSVVRQHALRKVFPPLAQDLAGGVQAMGCSKSPWSLEIAPLGATSGLACAGAEPVSP
jgi:hypothetical protein